MRAGYFAVSLVVLFAGAAQAQPYGPDTCKQGYVWREATADDHVCVPPATRAQARADNAQARYRVSRVQNHAGPGTCRTGYVFREATADDRVCVTPAVRAAARADNDAAASRYVNQ